MSHGAVAPSLVDYSDSLIVVNFFAVIDGLDCSSLITNDGSETVTFLRNENEQSFLGVWTTNSEHDGESRVLAHLDANGVVQVLAFGDRYLSDDANMYAPSSRFSYGGEFAVGEVAEAPDFYYEIPMDGGDDVIFNNNLSDYRLPMMQNVTVPYASYANCLVGWELDSDFGYTVPNFDGLDADLRTILPTPPTISETGGRALSEFTILAPGFGVIAYGDVDAATGILGDMYVLTDWRPVPEPSTFALLAMGAFGLLTYAWRRRRAV